MSTVIGGIYKIENKTNKNFYIGSAVNLKARFTNHINALRGNKHKNKYLQNSWNKYKEKNFEFIILFLCDRKNLQLYEQLFMDKLNPKYNICRTVGSKLGYKTPESVKKKISDAQIGIKRKPLTDEHKKKLSESMSGRKRPEFSDEWKENIRKGTLGKKHSEETKRKMSKSHMGHTVSEKTRKKLSKNNLGKGAKVYPGLLAPDGTRYETIFNLAKFCRKHNLTRQNIDFLYAKKRKSHKRWTTL